MSLSRPELRNPATRFMQWGGGADAIGKDDDGVVQYEGGKVSYWDKEANDGEGANIEVKLPFTFIVLDELSTITGFNEATNSGFWSNEVKDLKNGYLVVRNKQGVVAKGTYDSIKDEIKAKGAKYTKSIYIAFRNEENELVLGHIKFAGAAMSEWIEFGSKVDVSKAAVTLEVNPNVKTKGKVKYFVPKFSSMKIGAATLESAKAVDAQLQEYLDVYFTRKPETDSIMTAEEEADAEENAEENERRADAAAAEAAKIPADDTLEDGSATEVEQPAPAKPTNKPATAAKAAKKENNINLNNVEF